MIVQKKALFKIISPVTDQNVCQVEKCGIGHVYFMYYLFFHVICLLDDKGCRSASVGGGGVVWTLCEQHVSCLQTSTTQTVHNSGSWLKTLPERWLNAGLRTLRWPRIGPVFARRIALVGSPDPMTWARRPASREKMQSSSVPVNTKHLYNIHTTSAQRLRRWADVV